MESKPSRRDVLGATLLVACVAATARGEAWPAPQVAPTPEPPAAVSGVEPTRLFFAPTARSLPRGQGSFGLSEVIFPWVDVGILDRVSIQAIATLPAEDVSSAGVILAPKLQILRHGPVQVAVGVLHALRSEDSGGVGYGVVTIGSHDTSATVGLGYGYGGAADSGGSQAVVFVGAEKGIGRRCRIILEGYIGGAALGLPEQTLMGGARWSFGRWSLDLGAVVPFYETGSGTPFPFFTIARAF